MWLERISIELNNLNVICEYQQSLMKPNVNVMWLELDSSILFTPSQVRHRRQVDPLIVNFHPIFLAINLKNCQCQTQWPGQTGGSCETKLCIFIKLLEHNVNLLLKLERFKQSTIGRKRVSTLRLSHLLLFSRILEFQTKDSI